MKNNVEIPNNLEECFHQLNHSILDYATINTITLSKEEDMIRYHHTLGRHIRNLWNLWESNNSLTKYFNNLGITHPDDMSHVILISYHRHLNNKPIGLEKQIEVLKSFIDQGILKLSNGTIIKTSIETF